MNLDNLKVSQAADFTLPNGLKTIYHIDKSNPIVCVQLHIRAGSIYESRHQKGFSHFLEHLTFKSTLGFPDNSISDIVPALGGMINAYTDFDSTCYYILLPSEHIEKAMAILCELVFQTTFTAKDIELEKDIVIEEIKQYENEPEVDFIEFIQASYLKNNPMKYPVLGTVADIRAITYQSIYQYYKTHYTPENAFLVVCGDTDESSIRMLCTKYYAPLAGQSPPIHDFSAYSEPEPPNIKRSFRFKKKSSAHLCLVLPELADRHPLSNDLLIAMRLFAIGKTSLLYKKLLEQKKLCSAVKVSSLSGYLSGASVIQISPTSKDNIKSILDLSFEQFFDIRKGNISAEELDLVKMDIISGWLYSFESMESIAGMIASEELCGDYKKLYSFPEEILAVSKEQVISTISSYWTDDSFGIYYQDSSNKHENLIKDYKISPKTGKSTLTKAELWDFEAAANISVAMIDKKREHHHKGTNLYEYTTESGLKLIYKLVPEKQICGIALATDISQLCEQHHNKGINYLCSTAMLYGSSAYSYEAIQALSRRKGFSLRVSHHLDTTTFRAKCLSPDMGLVLKLMAQLLLNPLFPTKHISMIKSGTLDNLRREKNYPTGIAYKLWQAMLFGRQNNIDSASGTIGSISSISRADIVDWHKSWDASRQFTICIVGDKPAEEVMGLCDAAFAELKNIYSNTQKLLSPQPRYRVKHQSPRIIHKSSEQAIINMGGFGCSSSDVVANTAFHILAQVIGGDINSRMFNVLREKYGYAYQTGFDFYSLNSMGFWNAYAFCDPDDYKACMKLIKEIIHDVRSNGISQEELSTAQNYLIGMHRFDAESVSWQAASLSNLLCLGYDVSHYLSREERIRNISLQDVYNTASRWLQADNIYTHVML